MKKRIYVLAVILSIFQPYLPAQVWSELGGVNGSFPSGGIFNICSDPAGNIYAVGNFTDAMGKTYLAKYNGTAWSELGGGNGFPDGEFLYEVCSDVSGNIYAGGAIYDTSFHPVFNHLAKYNGTTWSVFGSFNPYTPFVINMSIWSDPSGNIYTNPPPDTNSSNAHNIS